jgi:hypothetical protein
MWQGPGKRGNRKSENVLILNVRHDIPGMWITFELPVTWTNLPGVRSVHISAFDVSEISVVDGVDFNRAE